jgi:hypothetical protein
LNIKTDLSLKEQALLLLNKTKNRNSTNSFVFSLKDLRVQSISKKNNDDDNVNNENNKQHEKKSMQPMIQENYLPDYYFENFLETVDTVELKIEDFYPNYEKKINTKNLASNNDNNNNNRIEKQDFSTSNDLQNKTFKSEKKILNSYNNIVEKKYTIDDNNNSVVVEKKYVFNDVDDIENNLNSNLNSNLNADNDVNKNNTEKNLKFNTTFARVDIANQLQQWFV